MPRGSVDFASVPTLRPCLRSQNSCRSALGASPLSPLVLRTRCSRRDAMRCHAMRRTRASFVLSFVASWLRHLSAYFRLCFGQLGEKRKISTESSAPRRAAPDECWRASAPETAKSSARLCARHCAPRFSYFAAAVPPRLNSPRLASTASLYRKSRLEIASLIYPTAALYLTRRPRERKSTHPRERELIISSRLLPPVLALYTHVSGVLLRSNVILRGAK